MFTHLFEMDISLILNYMDDETLLKLYNDSPNDVRIQLFETITDRVKLQRILNKIPEEKFSCPLCQLNIFWLICVKNAFKR